MRPKTDDPDRGHAEKVLLVVPIAPDTPGNGLAHRVRSWRRALRQVGSVRTVLVPTHGAPTPGCHEVVELVAPSPALDCLPRRASQAPEHLGRAWAEGREVVDLVVAIGVDVAGFALGAAGASGARTVVDVDNDDVAFHRSWGRHAVAARYAALLAAVRRRSDLVVSATGFDGTIEVPNAVAIPAQLPEVEAPSQRVLLVASFGYAPNVEAADWLVTDVWPLVQAERPDAELVIVGPGSESLAHGIGYVPDLAPLYDSAAVAVVPLRHGSGTRIKALEAFAHRVPVVGTALGLEGLAVVDGVHCSMADSSTGLARAILGVLDDPDGARERSDRAFRLVQERYETRNVEHAIVQLVREVLRRPRHGRWEQAEHLSVTPTGDGVDVLDRSTGVTHHLNDLAATMFALADGDTEGRDMITAMMRRCSCSESAAVALLDAGFDRLRRAGLVVSVPSEVPR